MSTQLKISDASNLVKISVMPSFDDAMRIQIETDRLYISSYRDEDFQNSAALYGNPTATTYFDSGKPRSQKEVRDLVDDIGHKHFSKGEPFGLFSIFKREDRTFVGHIDLLPSTEEGILEVGYILSPDHQGKGYGTEAAKAIVFDFVKELNAKNSYCNYPRIRKIVATVHPENVPSENVLKKLGMTFEKFQNRFDRPRYWYGLQV